MLLFVFHFFLYFFKEQIEEEKKRGVDIRQYATSTVVHEKPTEIKKGN
jgi:hypothetical protein